MDLVSDCSRCAGLCCVALPFGRGAAFAVDKPADQPCTHLTADTRCGIHAELRERGFPGCTVFECFGAGQQVTTVVYPDTDWRTSPDLATEMFAVFRVLRQVHEMVALLVEAVSLSAGSEVSSALAVQEQRLRHLASGTPEQILGADLDRWHATVGELLARVSAAVRRGGAELSRADLVGADLRRRDLRDADLRGALLVAADLRGLGLGRADLLGADLRDARVDGADLAGTLFLSQVQVNAARGSATTRLPASLTLPPHWA